MFKHRLSTADLLLIIVNLVPLYGVWFEGWSAVMVFLVYCLETVIIGAVNVLKMAYVTLFVRSRDVWENQGGTSFQSGWFFILFFILHYGFFVFVQTQLFFSVSGLAKGSSLFGKYAQVPALLGDDGKLLLLIFITYYTFQTIVDFFISGQYKKISLSRLMFQPYIRILIQQLVVITGSMFLSFGAGKIFILVLVAVKIFFEVFVNYDRILNLAERKTKDPKTDLPQ